MSCQVLDAGTVPLPWFERLLTEQQATAAIYLGASGEPPAWSGMNFRMERGVPCTERHLLPEISVNCESGLHALPGGSGYRAIHSVPQYENRLRNLFHALRPLKIVVGCVSPMGNEILRKLLAATACESIVRELPRKKTDWTSPLDPDRKGIASLVRRTRGASGLSDRGGPATNRLSG